MTDTTISLPEDLADELYNRKARGESYADVIRRLIEKADTVDAEDDDERGVTPATDAVDGTAPTPPGDADSGEDAVESGDISAVVAAVAEDTLPGSGAKLDDRRDALLAAVEYLREQGEATPSDFQAEVYPDHPARYTDGEDPARSWWKNCIYKGLGDLADRTDAVGAADTTGVWTWREPEGEH